MLAIATVKTGTRRRLESRLILAAHAFIFVCLCAILLGTSACQTVLSFPPANLQEPGWTVREGQAIWTRKADAPELAGDIILATHPDGRALVQFSKGAFPFLIAQSTPERWEIELPTQNKRYSGRGDPPARLIFLYLPRALHGDPLPPRWTWQQGPDGWLLRNGSSGESLQGYFAK